MLLTSVAIPAINPHLMHLNFDPINDLSTVAVVAAYYTALVVPAKSPFKTVGELVAYGKAHPGKLSYGSSDNGSITHLTAELFTAAAGIKALHVPYKGNPQVIQDLLRRRRRRTDRPGADQSANQRRPAHEAGIGKPRAPSLQRSDPFAALRGQGHRTGRQQGAHSDALREPFTRFGEMTHKGDGAGLGLAVVRSVLDFLGGSVRVDSEPGTCGG